MKILETDLGWAVEHNGRLPIKLDGEEYFPDKAVLEAAIVKRDLYIWSDGSVERTPEKLVVTKAAPEQDDAAWEAAAPKDSSGAPPTEDPPTDPNAQPDDPDPNPVSPEPVTTKPKKSRATGGTVSAKASKRVNDKLRAHAGDHQLTAKQIEALGGKEQIEKLAKAAKAKTVSPEDPSQPRRGRPRKYTPEEAEKRRRDQARKYAAERTEEQKALARERARRWRENNPDKVKEARQKSIEKRTQRYQTDPEYRQQFNEYQRTYKRSKREVAE